MQNIIAAKFNVEKNIKLIMFQDEIEEDQSSKVTAGQSKSPAEGVRRHKQDRKKRK